jgi:hypothetical protein
MSDTMYQAAQGSDSAVAAFKSLGLSVGELRSMAPDEAFTKLASAVASVEDPFLRAGVAKDVFGKQGTQLLPLLADGADGLEKMRQEARDLGITMGGDAAAASNKFNDVLSKLGRSVTGVQFALGSAFLPIIERVVDSIQPVISHIAKWINDNPDLAAGITGAALAVTGMTFALSSLGLIIPSVRIALFALGLAADTALGPIGLSGNNRRSVHSPKAPLSKATLSRANARNWSDRRAIYCFRRYGDFPPRSCSRRHPS